MSAITGGKIIHSNSMEYLQGVKRGVEYVNDGPIFAHDVEPSNLGNYAYMLALEDEDADEVDVEKHDG